MLNLLKKLYDRAEGIKGTKLIALIFAIFAVFVPSGIILGNIINPTLNKNENVEETQHVPTVQKIIKEGKVVYTNPAMFPNQNISYVLIQQDGSELLLKSKDQKLAITEGLTVSVAGSMGKTADGSKEVLNVSEVIIKNVAN